VQRIAPLVRSPTSNQGTSGIEKTWVQNLINGGAGSTPTNATQPKARGIMVIGGVKGAGTNTGGVCSTPTN